jgi:hypothetical protein
MSQIVVCNESSTSGPIIAANDEYVLSLSRLIETDLIDENAKYRVTANLSLGPDFKNGNPYKSVPFILVRSK